MQQARMRHVEETAGVCSRQGCNMLRMQHMYAACKDAICWPDRICMQYARIP